MVQIIGAGTPRGPSLGQQLSAGIGKGLEIGSGMYEKHKAEKQQQEQKMKSSAMLKQLTGMDIGDLPPDMQKVFLQEHMKGQASEKGFGQDLEKIRLKSQLENEAKGAELAGKTEKENAEKTAPFQAGLDALSQMRRLRQKGNLGFGSGVKGIFSPETRRERGEYEQLGKSLISLASNIPIRNQLEFQTMAEKLYDPSVTDAEAEGILNAMERIISNSMGGDGIGARGPAGPKNQGPQGQPQERPPLSSFHR